MTLKRIILNGFETFILIILLILAFVLIIFLFITLIENPVSLAILCGTILLLVMWWTK